MKPLRDVVAAIGRTPLIKLRTASEATESTMLGKAIGIAMVASAWGFRTVIVNPDTRPQ